MKFFTFLIIFELFYWLNGQGSQKDISQYNIINAIITTASYKNTIRPSDQTTIYFDIQLRQIVQIDEKNQLMTSSFYLQAIWNDPRLTWTPATYNNVQEIVISATTLWLPDFYIINSGDTNGFVPILNNNLAHVTYDGNVYLIVNLNSVKTRCKMNVFKFPFDTQNCSIAIGAWQTDMSRVNFLSGDSKIDISKYMPSPVWNLVSVEERSIFTSDRNLDDDTKNEDVWFNLIIRRMPLYYMMNNIFPCLILNMVTLLSYSLAFAQQIGLCMTTFLTMAVTSVRVANDIPPQSIVLSMISLYFVLSICYVFMSLAWFVIANNFSTKSKLPTKLKKFAEWLKKILFFLFDKPNNKVEEKDSGNLETNKTDVQKDENVSKEERVVLDKYLSETKYEPDTLPPLSVKKCNKCDFCAKCEKDNQKEKDKKKNKDEIESCVSALNYFAFFIMFMIEFICNLTVWLIISS